MDKHSLLLAPAERADVIVDFSQFAGKTLILYNDAPAAFPARVASYDYYTGAPDLSPNGAPTILPGYGPNTRTDHAGQDRGSTPAPAFNLTKLQTAFSHKARRHRRVRVRPAPDHRRAGGLQLGLRHELRRQQQLQRSRQHRHKAATGSSGSTTRCTFGFNTLQAPTTKMTMPLQPKAIHDEMNSTTFDEFGRMQANLGVEAQPPTPGAQNVTLYPFVNPSTELIDATNLPKADVTYDATACR